MPIQPVPILGQQQGNDVAPAPDGYAHITNPLNPLLRSGSRLAHFSDGVYDLSAESHLTRLLKALLGESGVGGAQRQMLLVRLQQSMAGTNFFDLDAFYGAIFGAHRTLGEHLDVDPLTQDLPASQWDTIQISDASYRSRVARLSSAIHMGATPRGIEAVAEALTGIDFDVIESWTDPDTKKNSWDTWESGTWDDMEAFTWGELEASPSGTSEARRNVITLFPSRAMTAGERFDLERALDRIRPAQSIVIVSDSPPDEQVEVVPVSASADSTRWEVRQTIQNQRINGALPFPDMPEDDFVEPPVPPWSSYAGEAWTVLDRPVRVLAHYTAGDVAMDRRVPQDSVVMPPQALKPTHEGSRPVSMPEFALRPIQGIYSGRAASDGIVLTNPYSPRGTSDVASSAPAVKVDRMNADFVAANLQLTAVTNHRFWTTPIRPAEDPASEIMEMRFSEAVVVNHVSFDFARFPCSMSVQAWDATAGEWIELGSATSRDSSPFGIPMSPPAGAVHHYHFGGDHWKKMSLSFEARSAQRWRVVLRRIVGPGPVGVSGTRIPYPLGLRDVDMGFRISSPESIPNTSPALPVGSTRNIVGLQAHYDIHRYAAERVTDDAPTAWICEPQPIRDAVVNMYLRARAGGAQPINQLFVDPTHHGAVMNLYYTSGSPDPDVNGPGGNEVVPPVDVVGLVTASSSGVTRGLRLGSGSPAWVDIDILPLTGGSGQMWMGREYIVGDVSGLFPGGDVDGVTIDAMATRGAAIVIMHGVVQGDTGLHYWVQASHGQRVSRAYWDADSVPSEGSTLRLVVEFSADGDPVVIGSVSGGTVADSREWPDGVGSLPPLRIASGAWDRRLNFLPPDIYETWSSDLQALVTPRGSVTGGAWANVGSAGRATHFSTTECWPLGHSSDVDSLASIALSGDQGNFLSAAHDTDLNISPDLTISARILPRSWRPDAEQWIVCKENTGGTTGYGLSLSPSGALVLHLGTGSALSWTSTEVIDQATTSPTSIAVSFDGDDGTDSVARFWVNHGSGWVRLGEDVSAAQVASISTNTQDLLVGAKSASVGAFAGSIRSVTVADGIDADMTPAGGTAVFGFTTPVSVASDSEISLTDDYGAHAISITSSAVGLPPSAVFGPVVMANQASSTMDLSDASIGDLDNSFSIAGCAAVSVARLPSGGDMLPLFTKKFSFDASSPGWGFYLNSAGRVSFVVSDGTTQVESHTATTPTVSSLSGPICIGFAPHEATLVGRVFMRNGEEAGEVSIEQFGVSDYSNSQPVRLLADGSVGAPGTVGMVAIGSVGLPVSGAPFEDIAQTMAGSPTYPMGSNWSVASAAALDDTTTTGSGDRIAVVPGDFLFATHGYSPGDRNFWRMSGATERFGSPMTADCKLRLTGAANGYGYAPFDEFLAAPNAYCLAPVSGATPEMAGVFLRFHPHYVDWSTSERRSFGFVGGVPDPWGATAWTPIGQYILSKGVIDFPEVAATALKLEFTGLSPEPYESFIPTSRTVRQFRLPANTDSGYAASDIETAAEAVHGTSRFPDAVRPGPDGVDRLVNFVSPTAGMVMIDEAARDQAMQQLGSGYSFAQWQPQFRAPIHTEVGPHSYSEADVRAVSRTAFFVGLRTAEVRRRFFSAMSDTKVYTESLNDSSGIDVGSTNFEVEPGRIFTPESVASSLLATPRRAVSNPMVSRTTVKAIQFAAQQTGPVQVIPDDEFRDPGLPSYSFDSTSQWHAFGDGIVFWDQGSGGVRVSRNPGVLDTYYAPDTPIVHPPVSPVLASGYGHTTTLDFDSHGGISSPSVSVSPLGVLYAACRVAAWNELSADLFLRVYGSDGTTVLAQQAFRPKVGVAAEIIMPYILGTQPDLDTAVSLVVEQDGPYTDSWVMQALSAFDTSVLWEFSVDGGASWVPGYTANGLQYGVVEFPEPGNSLVWRVVSYRYNSVIDAVRIRPWYHRRIGAAL